MRYKFVGYSTIGNLSLPKIMHDRDLAQQDLLNEIYTRKGERVMGHLEFSSSVIGNSMWKLENEERK